MNDLATRNGGAVAANQGNFFESYGEQVSQKSIVGTLLKFSKGDFLAGEHNEDIPVGTKMVVNMDQLLVGWIRWANSKPTDQIMGLVKNGYQAPKRNTLGDHDEAEWEVDNNGKARDPWQFSNYVVMQDADVPGDAGLYTFATSSRGGLNAVGELCKAYGKIGRMKPGEYPVVALKVGSYEHSDKSYGRIKYPVFDIVGWAPATTFDGGEEEATAETSASQTLRPADSSGRSPRGAGSYAASATATKF